MSPAGPDILAQGIADPTPLDAAPAGPVGADLAPGTTVADLAPQGLAPAAAGSPLASLRERIAAADATPLHLDLAVPRLDGVWVRYRPIGSTEMNALSKRIQLTKSVPEERKALVINAAALAGACLGVFVTDSAGAPDGDPATWVRPGPGLAAELGASEADMPTAADTIIGLYRTEGDLMAAAVEVVQWSTQDSETREPTDLGE